MTLARGAKLGPYEIVSLLGAGGMGEVYSAKDTRLDRTVAIKVLPPHLSSNAERRQRFEREAKTISSLNHPHICALYDVGKDADTDYLVLEYLEGETLAHRLEKGSLPVELLLRVSVEIADALAAAHRHGVTHRDLKPGNIMMTKTGAKLLDFGLARPAPLAPGSAATAMVTQSTPLTAEGAIVGTIQYMAPEQLEGKEADPRSDIFAFGAVLYEMATGKRAFEGKTQASVIAAILERDPPPISTLQPIAPPALDRVVKECLAKDPDERWQSAHDLRNELKSISEPGSQAGAPATVLARRRSRDRLLVSALAGISVLLAAALVALVLASGVFRKPGPHVGAVRSLIPPPGGYTIAGDPYMPQVAVSPDGRMIAFAASDSKGINSLWVRPLDATSARRLEKTEGAYTPFWSPDSQFIGFFAGGKLMRIAVSGGSPQTLCEAKDARVGTWNQSGVILFGQWLGPVMRVGAEGGEPTPATQLEKGKYETNVEPQFLPDGTHFLYLAVTYTKPGENSVFVGSLDSRQTKFLLKNQSGVRIYPPGYLLFVNKGILMAQRFDTHRMELKGEPVRIADGVNAAGYGGRAAFSTSNNGILVFQSGASTSVPVQLTWYSREGKRLGSAGPPPGAYTQISLSPDEKHVAVNASADPNDPFGSIHIWLLDLSNGVFSRLTFGAAPEADPVWSPDSREILYGLEKPGAPEIIRLTLGNVEPKKLYSDGIATWLDDWSADGRFLAYHNGDGTGFFALPMTGEAKPTTLLQDPFLKDQLHFSPDGKWLAYNSAESGHSEIYIASFPKMKQKRQVSINGGVQPMWRKDAKELFYLSPDGKMLAVTVKEGATVETGPPKVLFQTRVDVGDKLNQYCVAGNGQKFLLLEPVESQASGVEQINVIVSWDAALGK